jgi:hypothetical protein
MIPPAGQSLRVMACRLSLEPSAPLSFPAVAANTFRGALGFVLPESVFRPRRTEGPSGLKDPPRPFVLRCSHLDSYQFDRKEMFDLSLNLFSGDPVLVRLFRDAFERLCGAGIGPRRVKCHLAGWEERPVDLDLTPTRPARRVRVTFRTPTELKGIEPHSLPPFEVLAARLRDRVSALRGLYGDGPLDLDFRAYGERARLVRAAGGSLTEHKAERRSARTGQVHPLSGFTGWVEYEGDLSEFLPFLEAGHWTGVGRQTVWGKGWIGVSHLDRSQEQTG